MDKTPQEKADEIYDSMKGFRVKNTHRKKCALNAVRLVKEAFEVFRVTEPFTYREHLKYWNEVEELIQAK